MYLFPFVVFSFFCFKQKTAYELRISDWSSDVCSSDLPLWRTDFVRGGGRMAPAVRDRAARELWRGVQGARPLSAVQRIWEYRARQIGRASCRARVGQYV